MTGQQIGYIRISSFDQHPERQSVSCHDGTKIYYKL